MAVETLHFRLGQNAGLRLTEIAQDSIKYEYNLQKGIDTIELSLIGIERTMTLDIISGEKVLLVDGDNFVVSDWEDGIHDKLGYEKFNPSTWIDYEIEKIVKAGEEVVIILKEALKYVHGINFEFRYDFESSTILKYIFDGDSSEILEEIQYGNDFKYFETISEIYDKYLMKAEKVLLLAKDLYLLNVKKKGGIWSFDIPPKPQVLLTIESLVSELKTIEKSFEIIPEIEEQYPLLDNYLSAQKEIDLISENGVEPVNIMDNYNAGWLAPNGDYYGLNGEISNMLHNQIADMLIEKGIIPNEGDYKNNPDHFLNENGWLRQHDNNFMSDLTYYDLEVTEEQKQALIKFASVQANTVVMFNHGDKYASKAKLEMMSTKHITSLMDLGIRKNDIDFGSASKPSIKDIRNSSDYM